MSLMRVLAVLLGLLAFGVSPAYAQVPELAVSPQNVARAVQIADSAWPDSSCRSQQQVTLADLSGYDDLQAGDRTLGIAFMDGSCVVQLDSARLNAFRDAPMVLCTVLVHEFGHLAGLRHSDDPADVMFPTIGKVPAACAAAFSTPKRQKTRRLRTSKSRSFEVGRRSTRSFERSASRRR